MLQHRSHSFKKAPRVHRAVSRTRCARRTLLPAPADPTEEPKHSTPPTPPKSRSTPPRRPRRPHRRAEALHPADPAEEPKHPTPPTPPKSRSTPPRRPRRRAEAPHPGGQARTMALVVFALMLLMLLPHLATAVPLPHQPAALQDSMARPMEECLPGSYLSGQVCLSCKAGEDYTSHNNSLDRCRSCLVCKGDQVQKSPCTTTSNTVCECKPGTFRTQNTPEFCQRCRDKCTDEEDEEIPCTPLSDRKCVPKATGGTRALEEPVTNTTKTPSNHSSIWIFIWILIVFICVIIVGTVIVWKKEKISHYIKVFCPGQGEMDSLPPQMWSSGTTSLHSTICSPHSTGKSEDNNNNETLSSGPLPSSLPVEQETRGENPMTNADEQSPGEADVLLLTCPFFYP
ncbi:tumor necrosis factor receptor superfamily member 10B-like [Dipodomys spectabilis]|uniref:tumor necrosis factor receptor superfamily member 10B-like n=1 Tax=Dipodomys spectabilis TaxID=105255 RepID=UPI001C543D17|nr:tumor necrosis factor receptor superfamily member 10B-like [Dipodomys spectabilis]